MRREGQKAGQTEQRQEQKDALLHTYSSSVASREAALFITAVYFLMLLTLHCVYTLLLIYFQRGVRWFLSSQEHSAFQR